MTKSSRNEEDSTCGRKWKVWGKEVEVGGRERTGQTTHHFFFLCVCVGISRREFVFTKYFFILFLFSFLPSFGVSCSGAYRRHIPPHMPTELPFTT